MRVVTRERNRDRPPSVNYNDRMLLLRYAALLTLVVWVGGLLALGGVAAPAIFDVTRRAPGVRRPAARRRGLRRDPSPFPPVSASGRRVLLLDPGDPGRSSGRGRAASPGARRSASSCSPTSVYSGLVVRRRIASAAGRDRRRAVEPARPTIRAASSSDGCTGSRPRCSWCRCSAGSR